MKFSIKDFDALSTVDLYYILQARSKVFVVEQNCVYQDIDEVDFDSIHLVAHQNQSLVGYCRIVPPEFTTKRNIKGMPMVTIGRVLVLPENRGNGIASQVMTKAIQYCRRHYRKHDIYISAQTYLIGFYESLGFVIQGEQYLEDGLEHIDMTLPSKSKFKNLKIPPKPSIPSSTGASFSTFSLLKFLLYMLLAIFIIFTAYLLI